MIYKIVLKYLEKVETKMRKKELYYDNEVEFYAHNHTLEEIGYLRDMQISYANMITNLKEIVGWIKINM
jgi:hypothetical protein